MEHIDKEIISLLEGCPLSGHQNNYPVQITANEEAALLSIPKDEFLKMMQAHEGVLTNFINILSSRAQFLSGKLRFLSFSTLREKLLGNLENSGEKL